MLNTIVFILKWQSNIFLKIKTIQKQWKILVFGEKVNSDAIDLSIENYLNFEYVLQCLYAKQNNCDYLITSDSQFYDCGINIYTEEEFLKQEEE